MKKRLDLQSLLENSQKKDLVRFLKTRFASNQTLANDFLIHFASTFELDESEFHLITDRIRQLITGKPSNLTHRKALPIKRHIQDLMDQTRDCHSRQNYRQAFIIISHVIMLLDQYTDQIPDKFGFQKLQSTSFQLLDNIFRDSPAPSLKTKMKAFLKDIIHSGNAIPFDETMNPYTLLLQWEEKLQPSAGLLLVETLREKTGKFPEHQSLWVSQQVQLLVKLGMNQKLISFIADHGNNRKLYESLNQYLPEEALPDELLRSLRTQYDKQQNKHIKNLIYLIFSKRDTELNWMVEVAIQEFFSSGDITILSGLMDKEDLNGEEMVLHLKNYILDRPEIEHFHLYTAYKHLERPDLLKDHLLKEQDVFEILPFLGVVYPSYREEMQTKLAELIEGYLSTHFGRPAINYLNSVMDEINHLGHYELHGLLLRRIRHSLGHRKHFQKLMKELVQ